MAAWWKRSLAIGLVALTSACTGGIAPGDAHGDIVVTFDAATADRLGDTIAPPDAPVDIAVLDAPPLDAGPCANPDRDGDGHAAVACGGDDCDDNDANRFPGNPEVCRVTTATDGVTLTRLDASHGFDPTHDEDCDPTTFSNAMTRDGDHDGDGAVDASCLNRDATGMVYQGTDCQDLNPVIGFAGTAGMTSVQPANIHPSQPEVCNGVDDNCNGAIDEGVGLTLYRDCDGDTYGDIADPGALACSATQLPQCMGHPAVTDHTDCDDTRADVHPNAQELCDAASVDENCNGSHNEGCACNAGDVTACGSSLPGCASGSEMCTMQSAGSVWSACSVTNTLVLCWTDADHDGFAPAGSTSTQACACPAGTTSTAPGPGTADCDDTNPLIHPGAMEVCNGADDNCDGMIDEGLPTTTYYPDCDGDHYGSAAATPTVSCAMPAVASLVCARMLAGAGWVLVGTDCDDHNAMVYPGAAAPCACTPSHVYDADGDGHDIAACGGDDCNDANAMFYPGALGTCACPVLPAHTPVPYTAPETCDGLDTDCDGVVDDEPTVDLWCQMQPGYVSPTCVSGACASSACLAGYVLVGTACLPISARQIAPLATATVTSQLPTFHWVLSAEADTAAVDVCSDGACSTVIASGSAAGTSWTPSAALGAGHYYWRTRALHGGTVGLTSPAWAFWVGARSAPTNTSWGTALDVNADGFADVAVGAPGSSATYVYLGSASGLSPTPAVLPGAGTTVASAGDVNGDGFADVLVTGPGSGATTVSTLFVGGATGVSTTGVATVGQRSAGDLDGDGHVDLVSGRNVYYGNGTAGGFRLVMLIVNTPAIGVGVGDLNADGFADLAVGDYENSHAGIFLGRTTGVTPAAPQYSIGTSGLVEFGTTIADAGDVNGDGYADVFVGTGGLTDPSGLATPNHTTYFRPGSATGISSTATPLTGPAPYGFPVAAAGDVNGDGFADLAVGAGTSVYVYLGSMAGPAAPTVIPIAGTLTSLAGAGDVNGDGYADLLVGVSGSNVVYVFWGTASGLDPSPTILTAPSGVTTFGASVAATERGAGVGFAAA